MRKVLHNIADHYYHKSIHLHVVCSETGKRRFSLLLANITYRSLDKLDSLIWG
jgi:hypothetical protein